MSAHIQNRKTDTECVVSSRTWFSMYLFAEVRGKAVCLVCGEQFGVFEDYNLNPSNPHLYETKHAEKYKNLTVAERE